MNYIFRLIIGLILLFSLSPFAFACTLYDGRLPAKTVKEMFDESDLVVRGQAIHIDIPSEKSHLYNRKVGLKAEKVFKSPAEDSAKEIYEIYYQYVLSSDCGYGGTHFVSGQTYFIVASRHSSGKNTLVHTSGEYGMGYLHDTTQWEKFLNYGFDTSLYDQYCLQGLKQYYDSGVFVDDIITKNTKFAECTPDNKRYHKRFRIRKEID